jgi:hypothetical protein
MPSVRVLICGVVLLMLSQGCVVYTQPASVAAQPVVTGPGVEAIEVEPPPADRVYVYDPGFPPGCYFYDGYYWYDGYRYPHDVFVNDYVVANVREHRFIDVEENRRTGARIEVEHRQQYAQNHGIRRGPAEHRGGEEHEHGR